MRKFVVGRRRRGRPRRCWGRLHQGRSEESGNGRERCVGQEQVATQDPDRRPHLKWDSSQKKKKKNCSMTDTNITL